MRQEYTHLSGEERAMIEIVVARWPAMPESRRLNLEIWFADPHAPRQHGGNENTSGLLLQFLPKGTHLSRVRQIHHNDIARLPNGRSRQTLGG